MKLRRGYETWVGLDFDGTLVRHAYPEIGEDIGAIPWLLKAQATEGVVLMLVTMRSREPLKEAVSWLSDRGVFIVHHNVNPTQHRWTASPKPYCHLYVDDAALGIPLIYPEDGMRPYVDWAKAGPMLMQRLGE